MLDAGGGRHVHHPMLAAAREIVGELLRAEPVAPYDAGRLPLAPGHFERGPVVLVLPDPPAETRRT